MDNIITLNLLDNNFSHEKSTSAGKEYNKINFLRDNFSLDKDFIFTDNFINQVNNLPKEKCYAWILEPEALIPHVYDYAKKNYFKFNKIFSSSLNFVKSVPNGIYTPFGTCWIKEKKIHKKSKKISMIFSNKNFLPGHRLRHDIFSNFKNYNIDFFGFGVKPISNKEEALCDYMYSIVIENSRSDGYFTEKIIDSLSTGTIPIYYGPSNIGEFFNKKTILEFSSLHDLKNILDNISEEFYYNNMKYIQENYEECLKYEFSEEFIYNFFINKLKGEKNE